MKKIKEFYNNNRVYSILMIISILCLILIGSAFIFYFVEQTKNDEYGKRLYGIENITISNETKTNIIEKIKENENVEKANIDIKGKIIYLIIELKSGKVEDAQGLAIKSLDSLSADEKEFYDISFTVTNNAKDDNAKLFPIMGYKKSDSTLISWTKISEKKQEE